MIQRLFMSVRSIQYLIMQHICVHILELLVSNVPVRIELNLVNIAQKCAAKDNIIDFIDVINLIYFYEKNYQITTIHKRFLSPSNKFYIKQHKCIAIFFCLFVSYEIERLWKACSIDTGKLWYGMTCM